MKKIIPFLILFAVSFSSYSNDLNDGISFDTAINDDLKLDTNISFIKIKAKSKIKRNKAITNSSNCQGAGNINIGPGTKLKPGTTIINMANIKNSSTACSKK